MPEEKQPTPEDFEALLAENTELKQRIKMLQRLLEEKAGNPGFDNSGEDTVIL